MLIKVKHTHGLQFSVAATDFDLLDCRETTYEISLDPKERKSDEKGFIFFKAHTIRLFRLVSTGALLLKKEFNASDTER